jgi:TetR/AcrR family transcriptional repressor of lmrAB and yxaGH operons
LPRRPKFREPIIDAAVTLFRRNGYASTGLNDIVDMSGAPKGSLYHYFPQGKSSIAVAAVEEAGRRVAATLEDLSEQTADCGALITAHARLLARWMEDSGYRAGCPITTVLLELAPQERAVSEAGRGAYAARIAILTQKLEADGHGPDRARSLAILCVSALQGALIQSRIDRSGRPITTAARELARLLEQDRPA